MNNEWGFVCVMAWTLVWFSLCAYQVGSWVQVKEPASAFLSAFGPGFNAEQTERLSALGLFKGTPTSRLSCLSLPVDLFSPLFAIMHIGRCAMVLYGGHTQSHTVSKAFLIIQNLSCLHQLNQPLSSNSKWQRCQVRWQLLNTVLGPQSWTAVFHGVNT